MPDVPPVIRIVLDCIFMELASEAAAGSARREPKGQDT